MLPTSAIDNFWPLKNLYSQIDDVNIVFHKTSENHFFKDCILNFTLILKISCEETGKENI